MTEEELKKEAKEYAEKHKMDLIDYHDFIYMEDAYIAGYNKANEWQYVSEGKYPKEFENIWCYCKGPEHKFCCEGHTVVGGDNKIRWWANNKSEELRVIAWKEIVLPEEM